MKSRRFFKGPIFWIVLAVLLVLIGSSLISGLGGPTKIDTSVAVSDIAQDRVEKATLIDRDQVLELTLKDGSEVRSQYIAGQGVELQRLLQTNSQGCTW